MLTGAAAQDLKCVGKPESLTGCSGGCRGRFSGVLKNILARTGGQHIVSTQKTQRVHLGRRFDPGFWAPTDRSFAVPGQNATTMHIGEVVPPSRLERETSGSTIQRSNQLS